MIKKPRDDSMGHLNTSTAFRIGFKSDISFASGKSGEPMRSFNVIKSEYFLQYNRGGYCMILNKL